MTVTEQFVHLHAIFRSFRSLSANVAQFALVTDLKDFHCINCSTDGKQTFVYLRIT
jgi:hypothetical protein